jgi:hypothetical protein
MLFDGEDLRLATGPQGRKGYHLVEWLAAVLAHHLTGWNALIGKYQMPKHKAKRKLVNDLGLGELLLKRPARFGQTQAPDLLLYAPDLSDWRLLEVKGPDDAMRGQQPEYFAYLEQESGKRIELVRFRRAARRAGV